MQLYERVCFECSKLVTKRYSTSFSLGIKMFDASIRLPIYGIYGFVRFADEIVDTFHTSDKSTLLAKFKQDTFDAINDKLSLNPILQSFQSVVNSYDIDHDLITAFLDSMAMDLEDITYDEKMLKKYIYGSAEVVGLMCLKVFVGGDKEKYESLREPAESLGSAFQKINFLRDIKSDYIERGRVYFPNIDYEKFDSTQKKVIEDDIQKDFDDAYEGIVKLPKNCRLGVLCAYKYYLCLFFKIKSASVETVKQERLRVSDKRKIYLLTKATIRHNIDWV